MSAANDLLFNVKPRVIVSAANDLLSGAMPQVVASVTERPAIWSETA